MSMRLRPAALLVVLVLAGVACGAGDAAAPPADPAESTSTTFDPDLAPDCADVEAALQPPVDGPLSDDPEVAEAQRWRAGQGLRSDAEWTEQVMAREGEVDTVDFSQHTITRDEMGSLRGNLPDSGGIVHEYVEEHAPDTHAGRWIQRPPPGGVMTVAFTRDAESHQQPLRDLTGDPNLVTVTLPNSYAELEAVQERVTSELMADAQEPGVSFGGIPDPINRVMLGVGWIEEGEREELSERYGAHLICLSGEEVAARQDRFALPDADPPPPEPEPILVEASPERVAPGDTVELTWPRSTDRGIAFHLYGWRGEAGWADQPLYGLTSDWGDGHPTGAEDPPGFGAVDVGIGGPGPDVVEIPDDVTPGYYRICTANTGDDSYCAQVEVSAT